MEEVVGGANIVTCCQHGLQEWGVQSCHMSCLAGKEVVDDIVHKGQQPEGLHIASGFSSGLLWVPTSEHGAQCDTMEEQHFWQMSREDHRELSQVEL